MSEPLRIGVLGCGMISADHLTAWSRCQGARVVASLRRDGQTVISLARR